MLGKEAAETSNELLLNNKSSSQEKLSLGKSWVTGGQPCCLLTPKVTSVWEATKNFTFSDSKLAWV